MEVRELVFGPYSITMANETMHSTYIERKLVLRFKDKKKVNSHFKRGH